MNHPDATPWPDETLGSGSGSARERCRRVLAELGAAAPGQQCCRRAEAAAIVQLAGGLARPVGHPARAGSLIEVRRAAGPRLARLLESLGAAPAAIRTAPPGSSGVAVSAAPGPAMLARRLELGVVDERVLVGLGPGLWNRTCDAAALWRGAVLATGVISRRGGLQIRCGHATLAMALRGAAARHLGLRPTVTSQASGPARADSDTGPDTAGSDTAAALWVCAPAGAPTRALLETLGVSADSAAALVAPPRPGTRPSRAGNLVGQNAERAAQAAVRVAERARADLEALTAAGREVPAQLAEAARLRIAHPELALAALAGRAQPPISKDALAGRLRRLHLLAQGQSSH